MGRNYETPEEKEQYLNTLR